MPGKGEGRKSALTPPKQVSRKSTSKATAETALPAEPSTGLPQSTGAHQLPTSSPGRLPFLIETLNPSSSGDASSPLPHNTSASCPSLTTSVNFVPPPQKRPERETDRERRVVPQPSLPARYTRFRPRGKEIYKSRRWEVFITFLPLLFKLASLIYASFNLVTTL